MDTTDPQPGSVRAALDNAATVAIVVHGVGDHSSVDILKEASIGLVSLWGDQAKTEDVGLAGLPLPADEDRLIFPKNEPRALIVHLDTDKHVVLPIVWSGFRSRAGRWASRGDGFNAMWVALPVLADICLRLFRCLPFARPLWKAPLLVLACLCTLVCAGFAYGTFYVSVHLSEWTGGPSQNTWYSTLVPLGAFFLVSFLVHHFAVVFDFAGDVAYYVSDENARQRNIAAMTGLIQFVADNAPTARIIVVGHSLGSVLVAQTLASLPPTYSGKGRTLLLTMGSPLVLMSRVFSAVVPSPSSLLRAFSSTGVLVRWINLWRTLDPIGRALRAGSDKCFTESSIGIGLHSNYWGDKRLWATMSEILRNPIPLGSLVDIGQFWRAIPLSDFEAHQAPQLLRILRTIKSMSWSLVVVSLIFQFQHLAPWERTFAAGMHGLIWSAWMVGLLPLWFVAYWTSWGFPRYTSTREWFHNARFVCVIARGLLIWSCIALGIVSSIWAYSMLHPR